MRENKIGSIMACSRCLISVYMSNWVLLSLIFYVILFNLYVRICTYVNTHILTQLNHGKLTILSCNLIRKFCKQNY